MMIKKSVGQYGFNISTDVETVQKLLNKARKHNQKFAAIQSRIAEDKQCGNKTIGAINAFQHTVLKFSKPDGTVEPGKSTWKALNRNVANSQQIKSTKSAQKPTAEHFISWFSRINVDTLSNQLDDLHMDLTFAEYGTSEPSVQPFRQGDPRWGKTKLGHSPRASIHGYGCAMVSLAMASTYLGTPSSHWPAGLDPQDMTPLKTNNILKKAGAFAKSSYMLVIVKGAEALGMKGEDSGVGKRLTYKNRSAIDHTLRNGGLVMAHVDYKSSWTGDHWILLTHLGSDGTYQGIDPTYGKTITLYSTPDTPIINEPHVLMYGRRSSMGAKTPESVSNYRVVRYVTLAAQ